MRHVLPALVALIAFQATPAIAESPFTYQGRLSDTGLSHNGTVNMTFRLWDAETGGTQIGNDIDRSVEVVDGLFQVVLDFGSAFDGGFRFLEIEVDGTVLTPRQFVHPVPMALLALDIAPGQFWRQGGNEGVGPEDFLGTSDETPFEIRVGGLRALRFEPGSSTAGPNIISGYAGNEGGTSVVNGSTVGGGGHSGQPNRAVSSYATVAGGRGNTAGGSDSTIGGGAFNLVNGPGSVVAGGVGNSAGTGAATVAGGSNNTAADLYSTVPGGLSNEANAAFSFAAGRRAVAAHTGSFVWADSTDADFTSTGANQFNVRAEGGAGFGEPPSDYFVISAPQTEQDGDYGFGTGALRVRLDGATVLRVLGNGGVAIGNSYQSSGVPPRGLRVSGVVHLSSLGAGGGNTLCQNGAGEIAHCSSSIRYKRDIVDFRAGMALVDQLRPVSYRWIDDGVESIGLVAEEVAQIDPRLATFDREGRVEGVRHRDLTAVLVAALQELQQENAHMQSKLDTLRSRIEAVEAMNRRFRQLEDRLQHLEAFTVESPQAARTH